MSLPDHRSRLETRGYLLCRGVVSDDLVGDLTLALEPALPAEGARRGKVAGRRNLLQVPAVRHLAASSAVRRPGRACLLLAIGRLGPLDLGPQGGEIQRQSLAAGDAVESTPGCAQGARVAAVPTELENFEAA